MDSVLDDLITSREAATILGCSPSYIAHLAQAGVIGSRKINQQLYLIDRGSVEQYKRTRNPRGRPPKAKAS